jgi:hypothetical protein
MQFRAAQVVQVSGMWPASRPSRCDRECPLHTARDRCLWHVGGTPARTTMSRLTATAPARPQGEVRPGDHRPRWQALIEGAAAPCRLAVVEYEAPVRSRAWKVRPVPSSRPDATPMAQVRSGCDQTVVTMRDRQLPVLWHVEGTAAPGELHPSGSVTVSSQPWTFAGTCSMRSVRRAP